MEFFKRHKKTIIASLIAILVVAGIFAAIHLIDVRCGEKEAGVFTEESWCFFQRHYILL